MNRVIRTVTLAASVVLGFVLQTSAWGANLPSPRVTLAQRLQRQFPLAQRALGEAADARQMHSEALQPAGDAVKTFGVPSFADPYRLDNGSERVMLRPLHAVTTAAESDSSGASYYDVFRGVDALRTKRGGIAHELLFVSDATAAKTLDYELADSNGITAVIPAARGLRFLARHNGDAELALSAPLIVDADGRPSTTAHWEVSSQHGRPTRLHLRIDDRRLQYPLVVIYTPGSATATAQAIAAASHALKLRPVTDATGSISGTLTDAVSGNPIVGEFVSIYDPVGNFITYGITDGAGHYTTVDGLDTGSYRAYAAPGGYTPRLYDNIDCAGECDVTTGTPISVTDGVDTPAIDFSLTSIYSQISGTVTANGNPLAGITVVAYDASGSEAGAGYTSPSGSYTVFLYSGGSFYERTINNSYAGYVDQLYSGHDCSGCDVTTGTPISVNAGSSTSGIDFSLNTNGGSISGHVSDAVSGDPITFASVSVFSASGALATYGSIDGSGNYTTFNGLATGSYYVLVSANGYQSELYDNVSCSSGCNVTTGTAVAVTAGAAHAGVDVALGSSLALVSGSVTDASSSAPLGGVYVDFFDATGNYVISGSSDWITGAYQVQLPASGTYYARTNNGSWPGYVDQLYAGISCSGCNVLGGTPIAVTVGSPVANVNFPLAQNGGTISGHVSDGISHDPVPYAYVIIYAANGQAVSHATADGNGDYTSFNSLAAGTYYAEGTASGYATQLYQGISCSSCDPTTGTPIHVTAGHDSGAVDFPLNSPDARIGGVVLDAATATPIGGITILVYDAGGNFVSSATSDSVTGAWQASLPTAGTYYARTYNGSLPQYVDQLYDHMVCSSCNPTTGTPITAALGSFTQHIDFFLTDATCTSIDLQPATLPGGSGGAAYNQTVSAVNATAPLMFTISSGSLPPGLSLGSSTGVISGTLPVSGSYPFVLSVTDANSCHNSRNYTITVTSTPTTTTLTAVPSTATYGTSISLNATVSPAAATGSVSYYDGATLLGSATLSSGSASLATATLTAGTHSITATYGGNGSYTTSTSSPVTVTIQQATPTITWPTPAPISYGTPLSATQLDATASTPGTFSYTPAAGTVLDTGSYTLSVSFMPTDSTDYTTASASVTLVVNKADQQINWPVPAAITYGTALGAAQLDATVSVPGPSPAGALTYTPAAGAILNAGNNTLSVTAAATSNYNSATATVTLVVNKANQTISWATPAPINYGTALGAAQLNATVAVPGPSAAGALTYTPAAGTVLNAGNNTLSVTAAATTNYNAATATVTLVINKVNQQIHWSNPAPITYGTPLGATQLNATVTVPGPSPAGALTYTPPAGTILNVGSNTLSVTAAATQNYNAASASVTLVVNKANQHVNWTTPAPITYGTPLGSGQLNATVTVPGPSPAGALTYTPPAGTVLTPGSHTLSVTAAATSNYNAANGSVTLTVLKGVPVFSNLSAPTIIIRTISTTISGKIMAGTLVPPGFVTISLGGLPQLALIQGDGSFSATFLTLLLTPVSGGYPISFAYGGSANFNSATGSSVLTVVYGTTGGQISGGTHAGATFSFRVQAVDAYGVNLSFLTIPVTAYGIRLTSSSTWSPATPAPGQGSQFKFQTTSGGSYRYDLKTTGLANGSYVLGFTVGNDPTIHTVPFTIN